jgi:hypothetical protein
MKSAKTITAYRRYTTRFNLVITFVFLAAVFWTYLDYRIKLTKHPDLPLVGMFFKTQPNSWDKASPF